jgi:deoxyadenosine/deoxycytidine kinase
LITVVTFGQVILSANLVANALGISSQKLFLSTLKSTTGSGSASSNGSSKSLAPILISIEGNIGAGKSTLLKKLRQKRPEWVFIDEPIDTWTSIKNENGESILEVFYKDRNRWSYTFQNCALLTRHQNIEDAVSKVRKAGKVGRQVFLTERCLETDHNVFTKMLQEEGSINKLEHDLYNRWLKQLKAIATPLSAIVHVDTAPQVCAERIVQRSRTGEEGISIDYLKNLDMHQRAWVENTPLPVFKTDLSSLEAVENFILGLKEEQQ